MRKTWRGRGTCGCSEWTGCGKWQSITILNILSEKQFALFIPRAWYLHLIRKAALYFKKRTFLSFPVLVRHRYTCPREDGEMGWRTVRDRRLKRVWEASNTATFIKQRLHEYYDSFCDITMMDVLFKGYKILFYIENTFLLCSVRILKCLTQATRCGGGKNDTEVLISWLSKVLLTVCSNQKYHK